MWTVKTAIVVTSLGLAAGASAQETGLFETRETSTTVELKDGQTIEIGGLSREGTGGRALTRTLPHYFSDIPMLGFLAETSAVRDDDEGSIGYYARGFANLPLAGTDTMRFGVSSEFQALDFAGLDSIVAHPGIYLDITPTVTGDGSVKLRIQAGNPVAIGRDYANGAAIGSAAGSVASVDAVRQFTAPNLQTVFEERGRGARADLRFDISPGMTARAAASYIEFDALGVDATEFAFGVTGRNFAAEAAFEAVDFPGSLSDTGWRARFEALLGKAVLGLSTGNTAANSLGDGDPWTQADLLYALTGDIEFGLQALDLGSAGGMAYGAHSRFKLDDRAALTFGVADLDGTTVFNFGFETLVLLRP